MIFIDILIKMNNFTLWLKVTASHLFAVPALYIDWLGHKQNLSRNWNAGQSHPAIQSVFKQLKTLS